MKSGSSSKRGVTILVVVSLAVIIMLFALRPINMWIDRQTQVNSHQYIEGMDQRARILSANIAEIDSLLATNPANRDELQAQRRALSAQLSATTGSGH